MPEISVNMPMSVHSASLAHLANVPQELRPSPTQAISRHFTVLHSFTNRSHSK